MAVTEESRKQNSLLKACIVLLIPALFIALTFGMCPAGQQAQETFDSPDEAVRALVDALKAVDAEALSAIFGPDSEEVVYSGDPIADKTAMEGFIHLYEQKRVLGEADADMVVLHVGEKEWPFPIPIVKKDGMWRFDTVEGREEILARRIGRNELSVIQTCLAYVDAQREYAIADRDRDGLLANAQKFISEPGKRDGLYWESKEGEKQSPLGALIAEAQEEGYTARKPGGEPVPYHGYYYRILKAQGKHSRGGAYDYVVEGEMIGGFALVAYPAKYGSSGIMTFIVNHEGVVYQKDLGENTAESAPAMKLFNPDNTWEKVGEGVTSQNPHN